MPPIFPLSIQWIVLKILPKSSQLPLSGYHTLRHVFPDNFRFLRSDLKAVYNTTSPLSFNKGFSLPFAVFTRCYSQHLDWFLFLQVLRRFNSLRSQSFLIKWEVSLRDLWFNDCMRLARAFCSLPHPSSAFEPSHPPNSVGFSLCTVSWISTNPSTDII